MKSVPLKFLCDAARRTLALSIFCVWGCHSIKSNSPQVPASAFEFATSEGSETSHPLQDFKGKVLLVANIHLKCGTTPQLLELEALYQRYKEHGLVVVGVPSEDFAPMDQKGLKEIRQACGSIYGVTFPILEPERILGPNKSSLFSFLTASGPEQMHGEVAFNFEKFLVGRDGQVKARYGSFTAADGIEISDAIEAELARKL